MTQPPLIYSLFNTITLALVSDLAAQALRHVLSFYISTFKKKIKNTGTKSEKKQVPVGEEGSLTIADWISQGFGKHWCFHTF